jgi:hypothetical protein
VRANPLIDTIYSTLKGNSSEKVSEDVRNLRLAKCRTCVLSGGEEKWNNMIAEEGEKGMMKTGNCKICGCFTDLKTEYKEESCPLGKW